jgi:hypothetical protein
MKTLLLARYPFLLLLFGLAVALACQALLKNR